MLFGQCPHGGGDKLKGASLIYYHRDCCPVIGIEGEGIASRQIVMERGLVHLL